MDTGSGPALIGIADVPQWNKEKLMVPCQNEIHLHNANGMAIVQNAVALQLKSLPEEVTTLVLDSTPPVLSIGNRCMDEGWAFHWEPNTRPNMVSPCGRWIELQVFGNAPYLVEHAGAHPASQIPIVHEPVLIEAGLVPQEEERSFVEDGTDLLKREDVRDLWAEALSVSHLMTHNPKNSYRAS